MAKSAIEQAPSCSRAGAEFRPRSPRSPSRCHSVPAAAISQLEQQLLAPAQQRRNQQVREVQVIERLNGEGDRGEQVLTANGSWRCSRSMPATGTPSSNRRATISDASSPRLRTRIEHVSCAQRALGRSEYRRFVDPAPDLFCQRTGVEACVLAEPALLALILVFDVRDRERLPQLDDAGAVVKWALMPFGGSSGRPMFA